MISDTIREVMKEKGITHTFLAEKLGYKYPSSVTTKLQRVNGLRVDTLIKFLETMDCELIIRSKTTDKLEWVLKNE
ncbi:Cro/C1-type HTH DNA-binding domain-containing protein [Acetitomaculum ruminis DSM 5522]|uniref:Cro/C1-type HTH DNA-binding domain-containing protein n=1 Tax=Acetitomaculum ruminis DSM 5522 TaxID=1120918 RepID=A0A1I1AQ89_9FIRM|nr:helix-turn-helix domain-containing protein [Acetitomaculum ruminis]SFB40184.1 Cro/C1-type HTH DNA-binding domain-containing protein [Acetitomaculum ruminis DSM 5522]